MNEKNKFKREKYVLFISFIFVVVISYLIMFFANRIGIFHDKWLLYKHIYYTPGKLFIFVWKSLIAKTN